MFASVGGVSVHVSQRRFQAVQRRLAWQKGQLACFPVPRQMSDLQPQPELYVLEPMSHSSLDLLDSHLVPHGGILMPWKYSDAGAGVILMRPCIDLNRISALQHDKKA